MILYAVPIGHHQYVVNTKCIIFLLLYEGITLAWIILNNFNNKLILRRDLITLDDFLTILNVFRVFR